VLSCHGVWHTEAGVLSDLRLTDHGAVYLAQRDLEAISIGDLFEPADDGQAATCDLDEIARVVPVVVERLFVMRLLEVTKEQARTAEKAFLRVCGRADPHLGAGHERPVIAQIVQLAGGIDFTWEYPVHHAMRRVVANAYAIRSHRSSLEHLAGADQKAFPDTESDFRAHARQAILSGTPFLMREGHRAPDSHVEEDSLRTWYRSLYDNGLLGASWPEEWGATPATNPP